MLLWYGLRECEDVENVMNKWQVKSTLIECPLLHIPSDLFNLDRLIQCQGISQRIELRTHSTIDWYRQSSTPSLSSHSMNFLTMKDPRELPSVHWQSNISIVFFICVSSVIMNYKVNQSKSNDNLVTSEDALVLTRSEAAKVNAEEIVKTWILWQSNQSLALLSHFRWDILPPLPLTVVGVGLTLVTLEIYSPSRLRLYDCLITTVEQQRTVWSMPCHWHSSLVSSSSSSVGVSSSSQLSLARHKTRDRRQDSLVLNRLSDPELSGRWFVTDPLFWRFRSENTSFDVSRKVLDVRTILYLTATPMTHRILIVHWLK